MTSKMTHISSFSHSCDKTPTKRKLKPSFFGSIVLGGTVHHGKEGTVAEEQWLVTLCLQSGFSDSERCFHIQDGC